MKLFQHRKISYKNKGRLFGFGSGPDADWKVLFSIFILGVMVSVAYSTMIFFRAKNDDLISKETESQINISKESVRRTADFYIERRANFEKIKSTQETVPNPAI